MLNCDRSIPSGYILHREASLELLVRCIYLSWLWVRGWVVASTGGQSQGTYCVVICAYNNNYIIHIHTCGLCRADVSNSGLGAKLDLPYQFKWPTIVNHVHLLCGPDELCCKIENCFQF